GAAIGSGQRRRPYGLLATRWPIALPDRQGQALAGATGDAHVLLGDAPPVLCSGAWLSPKRILLASFQASYFVSSSGGSLERLKGIYLWPQMLPDGEHVLYVGWDARVGRH